MSRPELEPLPPDIAALLAAERRAPPASAARQASILSRIEAVAGLATGLTALTGASADISGVSAVETGTGTGATATATAATAAKTAAFVLPISKALIAAATVAAVGFGAGAGSFAYLSRRSEARHPAAAQSDAHRAEAANGGVGRLTATASPSAPPATSPPAPEIVLAPVLVPLAAPSAAIAAAPVSPPAPARANAGAGLPGMSADMAAESALLEHARRALAEGHAADALADVAAHARKFPRGLLVEEREALWVTALVRAGERDAARARAVAFRRRFPRSIQREAIARALREGS